MMFKSISLKLNANYEFVTIKVWAKENELHYSKDILADPDESIKDKVILRRMKGFIGVLTTMC